MSYSDTLKVYYSDKSKISFNEIPICCKIIGNDVYCKESFKCSVKNCAFRIDD